MQKSFPINAPLSLGELLDRAFRLYRARFGKMTLTAALLLVPFGVLSALILGVGMVDYFDFIQVLSTNPGAPPDDLLAEGLPAIFAFVGAILIVGLLGLALQAIVTLALTRHSIAALHGEELSVQDSIRQGLTRFWPFVGMSIVQAILLFLATLAVLAIFGCAIALLLMGGGAIAGFGDIFNNGSGGSPNPAVFVGLGLAVLCGYLFLIILAIIPTTYISARWVVSGTGLVDQEWGAIESLRRSWALTKGNIWRSIFYVVLLSILSLVISSPVFIIQQFVAFFPPQFMAAAFAVSTAFGSLLSVIWQPFYVAAIVLLYYDLRIREEGLDLVQRIDQLAEAESDVDVEPSTGAYGGGTLIGSDPVTDTVVDTDSATGATSDVAADAAPPAQKDDPANES